MRESNKDKGLNELEYMLFSSSVMIFVDAVNE